MTAATQGDGTNQAGTPVVASVRNVSKSFGPVKALTDVSVSFEAGRVTALLGENGAGKSTLVRVLSGEHQPTQGVIEIGGEPAHLASPVAANRAGVAVVHQEPQLVSERTIAENLFLARLGEKSWISGHSRRAALRDAEALLNETGLADFLPNPARLCRDLSAAERQIVEIARALALQPKLLFLDEPNSSLTRQETERLFEVVHRYRDQGVAIILVSHRLGEVYEISDHIVVLRDGVKVGEGSVSDLPIKDAIQLMAGDRLVASARAVEARTNRDRSPDTVPVLSLSGVTGAKFHNVSLNIYAGEIVGMAGLVGSGRTETARAVIGVDRLLGGEVRFRGRPVRFRSSGQAVEAGMAFISEERRTSVFYQQDVRFNLTCTVFGRFGRLGFFSKKRLTDYAEREAKAGGVKAHSVATRISGLSGGNQQKVLIARALASNPSLIILDEPTRGVDVRTKADIYQLLRKLAHQDGLAVWVISSEMDEILQVSDRIAVMHNGTLTEVLERGPEAAKVVAAALGESISDLATGAIAAGLARK